ncbi:hypothetical protein, partial [Methyloglobulus sp.]|uniref:hypothetical protein n=1 Tax=Methyloglobulus sp. TaxID=2518622 RepID=UPI0032B80CFE
MNITTLLAYWIDQKNQADKELSDARVKLTLSQTELATQRANLTKANQELAALVTQNKKNHADMAEANPADVHALELELAKTITDTRTKQAEIIEIEAAVDTAQNALVLANATVNTATSRASTVASSLDADDQDKDRVKIGDKQAVRTTSIVKISNVAGHPFLVNDVITVMDMADFSFNGTFTINLVTDTSISYLQIKTLTIGRGKAARTANSVTISGLSGHTFKNNDTIVVTGMADAIFNGT